jgi:hypothetical protein
MNAHRTAPLCLTAALALLAAPPAGAESFASSASSASSASIGSLSTSIGKSSDASSGKGGQVARGDYRVIEVAAAERGPDTLRVRLQALDPDVALPEFDLYLPVQALPEGGLAAGQTVAVSERAYGLAFARAGRKEAFFLVLEDAWFRELRTTPVAL